MSRSRHRRGDGKHAPPSRETRKQKRMADKSHHSEGALQSSIHRRTRYLLGLHQSLLKHDPSLHNRLLTSAVNESHIQNFERLMSLSTSRTSKKLKSGLSSKRSQKMAHVMKKKRVTGGLRASGRSSVATREDDEDAPHHASSAEMEGIGDGEDLERSPISEAFANKVAGQVNDEDRAAEPGAPPVEYVGWVLVKIAHAPRPDENSDDKASKRTPDKNSYVLLPSFKPLLIRQGQKSNPRSAAKLVFSRYKSVAKADPSRARSHLVVGVALFKLSTSQAMSYVVRDAKSESGYATTRPVVSNLGKRLTRASLVDALMHVWKHDDGGQAGLPKSPSRTRAASSKKKKSNETAAPRTKKRSHH